MPAKKAAGTRATRAATPAPPPRPAQPTALGVRLAALDDQQLQVLLRARPDALAPPRPRTFERLAGILGSPHSILDVLSRTDQLHVGVAVALLYLGGAPSPAELLGILPADLPAEVLDGVLDDFEELLLVQRTADGRVHAASGMAQVVQMPEGYGPPLRNLLAVLQGQQLRFVHERITEDLGIETTLREGAAKQDLIDALVLLLSDPERVIALVRAGPVGTAELAERVAAHGPALEIHRPPSMQADQPSPSSFTPPHWLVEHGLVVMASWGLGMMPREIAAAIRGGRPLGTVQWSPPAVRTEAVAGADGTGEAAGHAAANLLERVGRVVADLERTPLPALKTGGIGARTLKPLARDLGVDEREAAFLIDLAAAAELAAPVRMLDPQLDELSPAERKRRLRHYTTSEITVVTQTDIAERWRRLPPAARWVHLVDAWRGAGRWVELAGRRDDEDKLIPALDPTPRSGDTVRCRRLVLEAMGRLPLGAAAVDASFVERLEWEAAMVWARSPAGVAETAASIGEAMDALGLRSAGALSPLGRVLVEHLPDGEGAGGTASEDERRRALMEVAAGVLPTLGTRFTLQADLTAMAAGPLAPEVITGLTALAEVESRGAASVFRFTETSLRHAFDTGRTAEDILAFLDEHADRGVPQPLRYLVADTERRHGSMRVGAAKSYVRSDDPAVLAEALKTKKLAKLELRLLAPTVAVCEQPLTKVLTALRAAGFLPAEEDGGGAVVRSGSAGRAPVARSRTPGRLVGAGSGGEEPDEATADPAAPDSAAAAGRGGDDTGSDPLAELAAMAPTAGARSAPGPGRPGDPDDLAALVSALRSEAARPASVGRTGLGAIDPGAPPWPAGAGRPRSLFTDEAGGQLAAHPDDIADDIADDPDDDPDAEPGAWLTAVGGDRDDTHRADAVREARSWLERQQRRRG